jgi:aromatic-amino-acid transaminase
MAPRDPILGLNEQFNADQRVHKVNLGVGVYYDDNGKLPLLEAIKSAEEQRVKTGVPRGYLPIDGIVQYNLAVQKLLFAEAPELISSGRVATVQCLGGTGALKVGADLLQRFHSGAKVYISDPSWENHRNLFESAGFTVENYGYYDASSRGLNFALMRSSLEQAAPGSVVVLHACCHNPTGADLNDTQWAEVVQLCKDRNFVPFLDIAYQGFGAGIEADAAAVRLFTASGMSFLVSSSFSKSFSLYGERVGAITVVCSSKDEAVRVLSQLKRVVRTNYSNPPTHGGTLVAMVLNSNELRQIWETELAGMRDRIRSMRAAFVQKLAAKGVKQDYGFVIQQRGMFSYSGLSSQQVDRMRDEFGIYAIGTGRICVAAMNSKNIDAVVDAVAAVS